MPNCPKCNHEQTVKNGHISTGKQRYLCRNCKYQFVENRADVIISDSTKELVERLLLERISLAGIARAVGVSERWLQTYVNKKISLS